MSCWSMSRGDQMLTRGWQLVCDQCLWSLIVTTSGWCEDHWSYIAMSFLVVSLKPRTCLANLIPCWRWSEREMETISSRTDCYCCFCCRWKWWENETFRRLRHSHQTNLPVSVLSDQVLLNSHCGEPNDKDGGQNILVKRYLLISKCKTLPSELPARVEQ